jgi:hypothetical protein
MNNLVDVHELNCRIINAKYGFVKLLIGESVGWCPFAIHFPDGDNASYGRMREHSLLVPLEDDYPKNESSCQ